MNSLKIRSGVSCGDLLDLDAAVLADHQDRPLRRSIEDHPSIAIRFWWCVCVCAWWPCCVFFFLCVCVWWWNFSSIISWLSYIC